MDAPPSGAVPIISSFEEDPHAILYDPELDALLTLICCPGSSAADYPNHTVNDLFTSNNHDNESIVRPNIPISAFKLQPRVHNPSPSVLLSYTPPPSATVVELQCLPAADVPAPLPPQPLPAVVSAPIANPAIIPVSRGMPSHSLHGGVAFPRHPHLSMPPRQQQQPPYYPNLNYTQACPKLLCCKGSQSLVVHPHHNSNLSFSGVEAKHQNQLSAFHVRSKLAAPPMPHVHHRYLQTSTNLGLPKLEVPTSPIACPTSGTASPAYAQSSPLSTVDNSDPAAMETSSASTARATPTTSNSSLYWASTPPERRRTSNSVPPSPTPSVNKKKRSNGRSPHGKSQVAFKVKTKVLDLHDGFIWKKYGEKIIKKEKHPRSYFKCDEKDRCGCEVQKRRQRCSNEEGFVVYTYLGRHNHPP